MLLLTFFALIEAIAIPKADASLKIELVRSLARTHLPERRFMEEMKKCPPAKIRSPPPIYLMCYTVRNRAMEVDKALKERIEKENAWMDSMRPKMQETYLKEATRRNDAWERGKKREESDIAERMTRARRETHADAEEEAMAIKISKSANRALAAQTNESPYSGVIERLNRMDVADRIETGHRGEMNERNDKEFMQEMSERAYRAERADTEDRGEYAQMAERRERDAHEALGQNGFHAESAHRSQRMDRVENQQRLIRNTEEDRASVAEKRGLEQDLSLTLDEIQDESLKKMADAESTSHNNFKVGMGGERNSETPINSNLHNSAFWKDGSNFAVPIGRQHARDLKLPHQQVFSEAKLGSFQPRDRFIPDYSNSAFFQPIYPNSKNRQDQIPYKHPFRVYFDSAGNRVASQRFVTFSLSSKVSWIITCSLFLFFIFTYSMKRGGEITTPLLLTNKQQTCCDLVHEGKDIYAFTDNL